MNGLDVWLYESKGFFSVIAAVVSVLGGLFEILTVIEAVRKWKEKKSKVKLVICIVAFLCVILFGVSMFLRTKSLLKIPNVEGKLYKDAKAILIEHDLEFDSIKDSEDKFVIGQTPKAGSIETEGTMVCLDLEEIHVHVWKTTVTEEPTCTSEGKREKRCDCGELEIEVVDEGDHIWEPATCTEPKKCRQCEKCEGTALGHDETMIKGYAATCTTAGLTDGKKCSVCREVTKEQESINALGHDEVAVKGYAATCTTGGLTDGKKCLVCGEVTKEQEPIKTLGHDEVTVKGYAATCTTAGLTDGKKCSVCGVVTKGQEPINALGHDEVTVKGYAATCTTAGLTDGKKCSVCRVVTKEQEPIKVLGHNEGIVKGYASTCTTTGLTDGKQCERCKVMTVAQQIIPVIGHAYSNDTDLDCNNCGYVRGYWSEYSAWSTWQDEVVTASEKRQIEVNSQVIAGYNKKTQWKYNRYWGYNKQGGYYLALGYSSGICTNYEETEWLDYPLEYKSHTSKSGEVSWGYGMNDYGTKKYIHWYNEQTQEVDDLNSPIYKTQYRYRDRYIIYY